MLTRPAAVVVVVAVLTGVTLLCVAMGMYPGGSVADPTSPGHSLWFNLLCDLTSDRAVNGQPNQVAARLARMAMIALSVAVAAFWVLVPSYFSSRRALRWLVTGFGLSSVVGLVAVPVASGWMHRVAIFTSSVPAVLAGVLAVVGIAGNVANRGRSRGLVELGCTSVALAVVDAVLYARSFADHPRLLSLALPLFQRLALLSVIAWMGVVALTALRERSRAPAAVRGSSVVSRG